MGYSVLLIPAAQKLMCSRCIYVGCYTQDVIFGLACVRITVERNDMQEETCGKRMAGSQGLQSDENFQRLRVVDSVFFHNI